MSFSFGVFFVLLGGLFHRETGHGRTALASRPCEAT